MSLYYSDHPLVRFFSGDCPEFAIALHRISNIPLAALVEFDYILDKYCLIHAFVMRADGVIVDASGSESTVDQMLEELSNNGDSELIWPTEEELFQIGYGKKDHTIPVDTMLIAKRVLDTLAEEGKYSDQSR